MCVSVLEVDIDNDKIVDVVEVITDLLLSDPAGHAAHSEIPRRSSSDLVRDMRRNVELTVGPTELELDSDQSCEYLFLGRQYIHVWRAGRCHYA